MSLLVRFGKLFLKSKNKICRVENNFIKNSDNLLDIISLSCNRSFSDFLGSYKPFDEFVNERRRQARRSILVQVNSDLSFPELHSHCSQFGTILGVHHYALLNGQQHFMLVEFENESEASNLISSGCFSSELDVIPVQSSFLWFRSARDRKGVRKLTDILNVKGPPEDLKLVVKNGCEIPTEEAVKEKIRNSNSLNEQIENLYETTRLDDLGTRLRYMVARQIECALKGLYPDVTVRPFGSTVNGFGKLGCDLDLLLRFTNDEAESDSESRLVFHTKKSMASGRLQQQRYMEVIGDIIQLYLPGCSHVRRILQARIPIIKYNQDYAGVECDLSMASMSGVYMSELLYMFGCLDERVRPLVFTVRKWAQSIGVTNSSPGRWITNFPLTLMVLFFLQNASDGHVLPSYNYLKKIAGKEDVRITDDHVNCTFLRDVSKINHVVNNNNSLEQLLFQFFEFYSSFDFASNAISINEGKPINKPDHSALYIVNPLEVNLNVSKNVSYEECERLRIEVRNAAWQLESLETNKSDGRWGLATIFNPNDKLNKQASRSGGVPRLVTVRDLFVEKEEEIIQADGENVMEQVLLNDSDADSLHNEIVQMSNQNKQFSKLKYKNPQIKKQVHDIKRDSETELRRTHRLIHNIAENSENQKFFMRRKKRR